jgi:O-acetyl-ADP-ribose deacetylase (regulator of RNase III)
VVKAYTQFDYGRRGVKADYDAIRRAMRAVEAKHGGERIGYPLLGAGLAGGDRRTIARVIDEELDGEDHTMMEFRALRGRLGIRKIHAFRAQPVRFRP